MRAVRCTDHISTRQIEEITFLPVEFNRHVRTLVYIAVRAAIIAHHKARHAFTELRQGKP